MRYLLIVTLVLVGHWGFSQKSQGDAVKLYKANKVRQVSPMKIKSINDLAAYSSHWGLSKNDELRLIKDYPKSRDIPREKYHQYYKGYRVIGGTYFFHYNDDQVFKTSGSLMPFIDLEIQDLKSYPDPDHEYVVYALAHSLELESSDIKLDNWQIESHGNCIIDRDYPGFSGDYVFARKLIVENMESKYPISEEVYLEAKNGKLINHFSNIHQERVKGVVNTKYYGEQEVYIDSVAPDKYLLKDIDKKVFTLTADKDTFENHSKYWNQVNEHQNEVAGDVHYGTSAFYDMMNERFEWQGVSGVGGELSSVVHARGKYYVNAYWHNNKAHFGNGDCDRYFPLTTLGIVGHEFTHGFTDWTSDLVYSYESGALNESMSDIFGKALEYYYDNENFNWLLGDKIRRNEEANVIRSMEDPNFRYHPKYYGGTHWRTGSSDNGGVHSNSGVLNYWFYLLVEGGNGYNEQDEYFEVEALGMDKALDIVFNTQVWYLTENSQYYDAMYYSLEVCNDLYDENSQELEEVLEAWRAVGMYPGKDDLDLSIEIADDFIALCPDSVHYPEYLLINVGRKDIPPGFSLDLYYKQAGNDVVEESILISDSLHVGDTLIHMFNTALVNEGTGKSNLEAGMHFTEDKNPINDLVYADVQTSQIDGLDLELVSAEFYPEEECGDSDVSRIYYRLFNGGCKVIEEDDSLHFDVVSDKGAFSFARKVFFDNNPGVNYGSSTSTMFWDIPKDFTDFEISFRHEDDLIEENNHYSSSVIRRDFVSSNYYESFDAGTDLDYLNINYNDNYLLDTLLQMGSNSVLGFAGIKESISFKNCEDEQDFFDYFYYKGNFSICLDARELDNPIFSFEHAQYRRGDPEGELHNADYSTMIELSLDGVEDQDVLVYAQREGDLIHYEIPLADGFAGLLEVQFIAKSGESPLLNPSLLSTSDAVVFDDLRLFSEGSAFSAFNDEDYLVFPNPADASLRLVNKDPERNFDIEIFNTLGQKVLAASDILNQYWLDVSTFHEGIYTVFFIEEASTVSKQVFVITHN